MVRVYLPPDANCLLFVVDHCLRSWNRINVVVAGKQPELQWLSMDQAIKHCTAGIGMWEWASNDRDSEPDVVMACAGDVPTLETLAAVDLLRRHLPDLKIRVVNVVDLMTLQPHERPSARPDGPRLRRDFHHRKTHHFRASRLSLAHSPADLSPHQSRQHPRAGLQGGRHDDDTVRHGRS